MRRPATYLTYLLFPLVGVFIALLIPPEKLPLRLLVVVVISGLGVIAADAGFRSISPRQFFQGLRMQESGDASATMAGAVVLMILSAYMFAPGNVVNGDFTLPVVLMLLGAVLLGWSVRLSAPHARITRLSNAGLEPAQSSLSLAAFGVLLLLAAGESAGHALSVSMLARVPLTMQAILFYGGIALLVMGLSGMQRLRLPRLQLLDIRQDLAGGTRRPLLAWLTDPRMEVIWLFLIFLIALAVRAWNLETGLRMSVDEAVSIEGVGHYFGGAIGLVGRPSIYITTLLFPQWQGTVISLLGHSVTSLRLASAIVGALTVVVIYYLARDLFDDRATGLIAALFLATFPPHVHFSRLALLHIADPLFGSLAVWFLIRGIRFNHRADWALAGAALGLTQYFFEAGRLFYIPLVASWLGAAVVVNLLTRLLRREAARLPWRGVFISVIALIMVAMPAYYAAFSKGENTVPRLGESGGLQLFTAPLEDGLTSDEATAMAKRILFPFTLYVNQPEIAVFYGGDQPIMLVYVVPLFLLGVAYLVWRWRTAAAIIPLWVLATAGLNALLRDSAVYARWVVVFPALAVTVAVALRYVIPAIWAQRARPVDQPEPAALSADSAPPAEPNQRAFRRWVNLLVMALLLVIAAGQVVYYYGWHTPLLEKQARLFKPYPDVFDAAIRAAPLPGYTDIYLIGDPIPDINVPRTWIGFLTKDDPSTLRYFPVAAADFSPEVMDQLPKDRNLALFIDPKATLTITLVGGHFGCSMQHSPYLIDPPSKEFLLCYVPASQAIAGS